MKVTYTIRKIDGEYKVTVRIDGKVWATYFTADQADAKATALDMSYRAMQHVARVSQ